MKKLVSAVLAMLMVLGLTVTAFAADSTARVEVEGLKKEANCNDTTKVVEEAYNLAVIKKGGEMLIWTVEEVPAEYKDALIKAIEASEYEDEDLADLSAARFVCGYETPIVTDRESAIIHEGGSIEFSAKSVWSWFYYGTYTIIDKTYEWVQTGEDSATGQGTKINGKGNWFMYNTIDAAAMAVGEKKVFDIQAGNNKDNIVGTYTVAKTGENTYAICYDIKTLDDTHKIQFDGCHLWVNEDGSRFITSPGNQKGKAVAVAPEKEFTFAGDCLNIFAHFNVSYWELVEVEMPVAE